MPIPKIEPPSPGEPITCVVYGRESGYEIVLASCRYVAVSKDPPFPYIPIPYIPILYLQSTWDGGWATRVDEEGVRWIRGHFSGETEEAKALLVRYAFSMCRI